MNVNDAVEKIGQIIEAALEKDENAIPWDTEIGIKESIVVNCDLMDVFNDREKLENMYTYEMFDDKLGISYPKKVEMVKKWIKYLNNMTDVEVDIDPDDIS